MAKSDFFSFVTSLRPIELKALGELSQVVHLEEGATLEAGGQTADALYIINRGAVEVIHGDPQRQEGQAMSYLSRGDMFGETSAMSGIPSRNSFKACESTSLQAFRKRDFPELMRRVPAFFYYISTQLASRLIQVSDMTFMQSNCLELSGNLLNFDLVTIYQTVLNSSQTGQLSIINTKGERAGTFYFEKGEPKFGQYCNLLGEQAFWQLFLHDKMTGTFSFQLCEEPPANLRGGEIVKRHPTDMLITALQYRDEFKAVQENAPDPACIVRRSKLNLIWEGEESFFEDLRWLAENIWQFCYSTPMPVGELYQHLSVNELDYYKVINELLHSNHLSLVTYETPSIAVPA